MQDLYDAEIPVPDQSAESHKQGLRTAMEQVLIKLTGDSNVLGRQALNALANNPENYVQQYKYRNKPVIEDNQLSARQQLYLWVSFNPASIDNLLRQNSVPVWGNVRPSTLVWFATQKNDQRNLIGLEDLSGFTGVMDNQARDRGVKLLHPLLDQIDQDSLSVTDVIGGFQQPIENASSRYNPDSVLTGSMSQISENKWSVNWISMISGEDRSWSEQGDKPSDLIRDGINRHVDFLAERYVQGNTNTAASGLEIVVQDITDFDAYSRVLKYLQTLNSVTRVDVENIQSGSATFLIQTTGGELAIQRAIELGRTLRSLSGTGNPYGLIQ